MQLQLLRRTMSVGSAPRAALWLVVWAMLLGGAEGATLELVWEPAKTEAFCNALPTTKGDRTRAFPAAMVSDYSCMRWLGVTLSLSPHRYFETAQGRVISPKPKSLDCDEEVGATCTGKLDLDLTAYDEIQFMWQSGTQQGSSFGFQPPIGSISARFNLYSPTCTGQRQTAAQLTGTCKPVSLLDDWLPRDDALLKDEGMAIGYDATTRQGKLSFGMDLRTFRGASLARISRFGISCTYDPTKLPAGCGGMQEWEFRLEDALNGKNVGEGNLERNQPQQPGVNLVHPFDKAQLEVQKGYPTPSDPCLGLERPELCTLDGLPTNGPCYWNGTACNTEAAPTMTPDVPELFVDEATFYMQIKEDWSKTKLHRVIAFYYTVTTDGSEPDDPKVPDSQDPLETSYVCEVPCELSPSNIEPGSYKFKFVAHLEGSLAGRYRAVFLSAPGSKEFVIKPRPTPMPTKSPPLPPGTAVPDTPLPPTPVPLTESPPTPAPPTPLPTPLPLLTDIPTTAMPPATPGPTPAPPPIYADPCTPLDQMSCTAPCYYEPPGRCKFTTPGPVILADRQRRCLADNANNPICEQMRIAPLENIPITYTPDGFEATVSGIFYIWCNDANKTACYNEDFPTWNKYPHDPADTSMGIQIPIQNCASVTDPACRVVQILAVAEVILNIDERSARKMTEVSIRQFFIEDDTLPPTPAPLPTNAPPTDAPPTLEPPAPATAVPASPSAANNGAPAWIIAVFIAFVAILLLCMGFIVYRIYKKNQEEYEDELDDMDEDELDDLDDEDDDDDDDYRPPPRL